MIRFVRQWLGPILALSGCLWPSCCLAQNDAAATDEEKAGFAEFQKRVQAYDKLRNDLRAGIPPVHKKDAPADIQKHEQALAQKIQDSRKDAKPGDIFTDDGKEAFRGEIQRVFSGKHGSSIRRTLVQGNPVRIELYVNKKYPDTIPVTTVPPTLLLHFPKLPKRIEYRIVGDNLVLEDTESRLVIDIFPDAFPNAPPH